MLLRVAVATRCCSSHKFDVFFNRHKDKSPYYSTGVSQGTKAAKVYAGFPSHEATASCLCNKKKTEVFRKAHLPPLAPPNWSPRYAGSALHVARQHEIRGIPELLPEISVSNFIRLKYKQFPSISTYKRLIPWIT